MGKKRGNSEGTIFFHEKKGLWCGQITVGRGPDGKLKRLTVYGKSRKEVAERLAEVSAQKAKGMLPIPEAITFAEWIERWLERKAREVRPKTALAYRQDLAPFLRELGGVRLQALRPHHFREALDRMAQRGASHRAMRMALTLARAALEEALRLDLVPRNAAQAVEVKAPKDPPAFRVLSPEEVERLLEAARPERLFPAIYLALTTGLRRGELFGLKWAHVDFEAWALRVEESRITLKGRAMTSKPKTANAARVIALGQDTVEVLRAWKARQEEERAHAGEAWEETGYLFTDPLGRPVHPDTLNHTLRRVCDRAGLPRLRVHDLRHIHATLMLRRGVPVEVVAERLGHASPAFTLAQYRHVLPDEHRAYALNLSELLSGKPRPQA